jgi:hypothetical protein
MVGNWDAFLRQVEQWAREMDRFMAHVDEARAATLSSMVLAPPAAAVWQPAVNVYETPTPWWCKPNWPASNLKR